LPSLALAVRNGWGVAAGKFEGKREVNGEAGGNGIVKTEKTQKILTYVKQ